MKRVLLLLTAMLPACMVWSQVNYSFTATTATYTPIAAGTKPDLISPFVDYGPADEGYANGVAIGFPFVYNGISYTNVNLNANGFMTFGAGFADDPDETFFENDLTAGDVLQTGIRPILAPLWDDLNLVNTTNLTYELTGTAPNRIFTVEWARARWSFTASSASMSFQVKLYETTNVIEFAYRREAGGTSNASASIGITGTRTGVDNFLSLSSGSANPTVSSTTETATINSRPPNNQVYRFTPLACIAPSVTQVTNVTSGSANFSWNAIDGVAGYEYAVSTSAMPPATGTPTNLTTVPVSLTPGVNNYLYVRSACGGGTFSNWSRRATVLCTTNTSPANGEVTSKTPTLTWNAVPDATAYTVMLSTNNTDFENLGSISASDTMATITNLDYSTTYYFYVRPVIGSDTASFNCASSATSFRVSDAPIIECVNNILPVNAAKNVSPAETIIKWNGIKDADGYVVMLSVDGGNTYENLGWIEDTVYNLGGQGIIDYSTTYYYYVRPFIGEDTASVGCAANATYFKTMNVPPVPENDDCEGAITLGLAPVNATTLGATEYMEAEDCGGFQGNANDDVWFKFTALQNGSATISVTNATEGLDAVIQGYSGTCGALVNIGCADETLDGGNETLTLSNLVAGRTYFVRVYGFYDYVDGGPFTIQLSGSALPIHLADFSGQHSAGKNMLNWTTQSEFNSKGFELQRSVDGTNFTRLHFEPTKAINGVSTAAHQYQYIDAKPFSGNSYYRLKHIDRDGSFSYSNIVLLKAGRSTLLQLNAVYPNPVTTQLNLVLAAPTARQVTLVVTDVTGKPVKRTTINVVSGDNNLQLNVGDLAAGNYLVKTVCADGCQTAVQKFVKN